ncbi:MAG: hypothetical protein R3F59_19095 [Myxococcota bacterium]
MAGTSQVVGVPSPTPSTSAGLSKQRRSETPTEPTAASPQTLKVTCASPRVPPGATTSASTVRGSPAGASGGTERTPITCSRSTV